MTPSYTQSTATLRCIKGYTSIEPGSAVCGDDGEWIIRYPECEGIYKVVNIPTLCMFTGYDLEIGLSDYEILRHHDFRTYISYDCENYHNYHA